MMKSTTVFQFLLPLHLVAISYVFIYTSSRAHAVGPTATPESAFQPPDAEDVCFSPDESCDKVLIRFIQSAKVSIDIAIFDITLEKLADELISQSKKLPVRILVDRRQSNGQHSIAIKLLKNGVNVRIGHQKLLMHNKFVIIDGKKIETGSFNFTTNATFKNDENQVYLVSPKILERYKAHFEKLWERSLKLQPY